MTVFTSDNHRKNAYMALNIYRKERHHRATLNDLVTAEEIREDWRALSPTQKQQYQLTANAQLDRAANLIDDVRAELLQTCGTITWTNMESRLRGRAANLSLVSWETLRKFVMSLPGSEYESIWIHPKLDAQL